MSETLRSTYEEVPYDSHPIALSHPDNLAVVATLHGLAPASPAACRVLELGCASGGNLLPMALTLPDSRFVGIDFSPRQIAAGQQVAAALSLQNIELLALDIMNVPAELGRFDYIICHGVYSWVRQPVKERLLALCQRHLQPQGVAYVSYNTYPGGHFRNLVRDLMKFHVRNTRDPHERARRARAVLDLVARAVPEPEDAYRRLLQREARLLSRYSDAQLLHDHLEEESDATYLHEFVEKARAHGLTYLAEAEPSLVEGLLSDEARALLARLSDDLVELEQYRDFAFDRRFRQTLLCHADREVAYDFSAQVAAAFSVRPLAEPAGRPAPDPAAVEDFRKQDGFTLSTDNPLVRALLHALHDALPRALPFADLLYAVRARLSPFPTIPIHGEDGAEMLASCLEECYQARLCELSLVQPPLSTSVPERPLGSPLARLQAQEGSRVTSLRHRMVEVGELDRAVLRLCDGTRDRAALVAELVALAAQGGLRVQQHGRRVTDETIVRPLIDEALGPSLQRLTRAALLME
jgi:SAM-dependent methyltransferase